MNDKRAITLQMKRWRNGYYGINRQKIDNARFSNPSFWNRQELRLKKRLHSRLHLDSIRIIPCENPTDFTVIHAECSHSVFATLAQTRQHSQTMLEQIANEVSIHCIICTLCYFFNTSTTSFSFFIN